MLPGYNTNGFAHHRIEDAIEILAEIGYRSVAVTVERDFLDPPDHRGVARCVDRIAPAIRQWGLRVTIETGARFILDPRRKHQPTLVSRRGEDRARRLEFLLATVDVAARLRADSVSLWSGAADDDADEAECLERLCAGLRPLLHRAEGQGIRLSFEPEPGMAIDTMARFERLMGRLDHPVLGLTLDVGHVCCLDDGALRRHLDRWRDRLWNVHLENMRRGVHEHLMFGEGDIDFDEVFAALRAVAYAGAVHVELSRHSHDAVRAAQQAYEFWCSHSGGPPPG